MLKKLEKNVYFVWIDFYEIGEFKFEMIYIGFSLFFDMLDYFLIYDWWVFIFSIYYDGGLGYVMY